MADDKTPGYPAEPGHPTQPGYPAQPGYLTQQQQQQPVPDQQGAYPPPQGQAPPGVQPPPPPYSAQPVQQGQQTVVVSTVHSTYVQQLRDSPVNLQCPNCHNNITTTIVYENGMLVVLMILLIAFVLQLYCGCCLIPLCIDALKDVHHICPVCSYRLGVFKRL